MDPNALNGLPVKYGLYSVAREIIQDYATAAARRTTVTIAMMSALGLRPRLYFPVLRSEHYARVPRSPRSYGCSTAVPAMLLVRR